MSLSLSRQQYAEMFGPTTGDQVRLGDTNLFVQVERDLIAEGGGYGNEVKFGGGKVIRDGMGQDPQAADAEALDLLVTNATILDPMLGVIKADLGIKHGRIVGVGHAAKEQVQHMVRLQLPGVEFSGPDAADALAIAICHAHHLGSAAALSRAAKVRA